MSVKPSAAEKAPYRGVKTTTWHDEKFFTLSDAGKLVWFHVYTNPYTNGLGMYHATREGLAANSRMDPKRYREGFEECLGKGLFEYDEMFQVVYFPRYLRHNRPANPNVMVSLLDVWAYIPPTPLKARLYAALEGLGEGFASRLETLGLTLPATIPETETETETENISGKSDDFPSCPEPSSSGQAVAVDESDPVDPGGGKPHDDSAVVITLPTNRFGTVGEEYPVTESEARRYAELYPAVNIGQALRSIAGWCEANPSKRKTRGGMPKFINAWLAREQDRGGSHGSPRPQSPSGHGPRQTPAERQRAELAALEHQQRYGS